MHKNIVMVTCILFIVTLKNLVNFIVVYYLKCLCWHILLQYFIFIIILIHRLHDIPKIILKKRRYLCFLLFLYLIFYPPQYTVFLEFLWKESLNSDSHQFHQYQQNKTNNYLSSKLNSLNTKDHDMWHEMLKIQILALDRHKNVAGVNRVDGTPTLITAWC
jgi:hypothetical protein